MTRHSLQPPQCAARRGDTRCHRGRDHDGPHRAPWADDNGTEYIRWWFTADRGWVGPILSKPVTA